MDKLQERDWVKADFRDALKNAIQTSLTAILGHHLGRFPVDHFCELSAIMGEKERTDRQLDSEWGEEWMQDGMKRTEFIGGQDN